MVNAVIEVIAPSRGRPSRAKYMAESWDRTRHSRFTHLTIACDELDPSLATYVGNGLGQPWFTHPFGTGTMVERTNWAAKRLNADIFGWAADDNVFITRSWDEAVREAFEDPAVTTVNTNDLLVGDEKGGSYFVRGDVVRKLGWLLPPFLDHLYVDFAVTALAKKAGTYVYLPEVIIEHAHPYAGKAPWDDLYRSVNNPEQDRRDGDAFRKWWNEGGADKDAEVLRTWREL